VLAPPDAYAAGVEPLQQLPDLPLNAALLDYLRGQVRPPTGPDDYALGSWHRVAGLPAEAVVGDQQAVEELAVPCDRIEVGGGARSTRGAAAQVEVGHRAFVELGHEGVMAGEGLVGGGVVVFVAELAGERPVTGGPVR